MIPASTPANEEQRLMALRDLRILDTPHEERFDRLTRLASKLFSVPVALVSLVDEKRQWFKSNVGLAVSETPRDVAFCSHAIHDDDVMVVPDAAADERFHDNPLVMDHPNIRFYAGCPLTLPTGHRVGTLCIIDHSPRQLDESELQMLADIAALAEQELAYIHSSTMDDLTNLSNRRGFLALAKTALRMCERLGEPAALLFFDLDNLKQINDAFGHAKGDRVLRWFAVYMKRVFRETDVTGRYGGDEFLVFMPGVSAQDAQAPLDRLRRLVDRHNTESKLNFRVEYSVGIQTFDPERPRKLNDLIHRADKDMYRAKSEGRANRPQAETAESTAKAVSPKVLLLDDDRDVLDFCAAVLEQAGYEVSATQTFAEFMERLDRGPYRAILLDLRMPTVDGIQIVRLLAERKVRTPIVLMSAGGRSVMNAIAGTGSRRGLTVVGLLEKPFTPERLRALVKDAERPQPPLRLTSEHLAELRDEGMLQLRFDPKVDLRTGEVLDWCARICGWHPDLGAFSLQDGEPCKPESAYLAAPTLAVAKMAFAQAAEWAKKNIYVRLSIEIDVPALHDIEDLLVLPEMARRYGVSPQRVTLDIPEEGLLRSSVVADRLCREGFKLALEHYWIGYLRDEDPFSGLPAEEILIDAALVSSYDTSSFARYEVKRCVTTAQELGVRSVAEGCLTEETVKALQGIGCDAALGPAIGLLVPARRVPDWTWQRG